MRDLYDALQKAMREQTRTASHFASRWRDATSWQHNKKDSSNAR